MVSGEDSTVRPLRAATPPEDAPVTPRRGWIPRPRRPRRDPAVPPAAPTDDAPQVGGPTPGDTPQVGGPTPGDTPQPAPAAGPDGKPEPTADRPPPQAATDPDGEPDSKTEAGSGTAVGRRRRIPFAHAVRLPPPRQAVGAATRATRAWSRRPSGRLTLPGLFLFGLVAATAAVGAVVVPNAVRAPRPVAVDETAAGSGAPTGGATPVPVVPGATVPTPPLGSLPPGGTVPTGPTGPTVGGRPADALGDWARVTGSKVGISPIAMQAYGYAELVLAQTNRSCQLSWTTLAAIGYVESRHGQANGATLGPDGRAVPEIIGDPLDGQGGRSLIRDTDGGLFDRDTVYDRAIGPMQFIPTTWEQVGADADNDGRKDPHDLDDTALAAGNYLCQGGRNMTIPGDWWGAILSYNDVRRYAQDVFDKAQEYGRASRT
ncbi:lytic transglycosylase domain-containing protein [Micromonospora rifamycinica]|uniref:lytic transglycosylase domain-containing protein n=1 Tax=Micromonospora rifamycinica TaxID=291594 RepID=UPI0009FCF845|nr:lytic transglycosylase domain-containing protein [Micromonospora rifamycinica]